MYNTLPARKGKACIICLHKFEVGWLVPLNGYKTDKTELSLLWDNIGFDVFLPETDHTRCLTANVSIFHFTVLYHFLYISFLEPLYRNVGVH